MSSTTLIKVPCGCEVLEVLDTNGELFLRVEGCKEHPLAQGKDGSGWAIVNYVKQLEAENKEQEDGIIHALQTPIGAPLTQSTRFVLTDALKAGGR